MASVPVGAARVRRALRAGLRGHLRAGLLPHHPAHGDARRRGPARPRRGVADHSRRLRQPHLSPAHRVAGRRARLAGHAAGPGRADPHRVRRGGAGQPRPRRTRRPPTTRSWPRARCARRGVARSRISPLDRRLDDQRRRHRHHPGQPGPGHDRRRPVHRRRRHHRRPARPGAARRPNPPDPGAPPPWHPAHHHHHVPRGGCRCGAAAVQWARRDCRPLQRFWPARRSAPSTRCRASTPTSSSARPTSPWSWAPSKPCSPPEARSAPRSPGFCSQTAHSYTPALLLTVDRLPGRRGHDRHRRAPPADGRLGLRRRASIKKPRGAGLSTVGRRGLEPPRPSVHKALDSDHRRGGSAAVQGRQTGGFLDDLQSAADDLRLGLLEPAPSRTRTGGLRLTVVSVATNRDNRPVSRRKPAREARSGPAGE